MLDDIVADIELHFVECCQGHITPTVQIPIEFIDDTIIRLGRCDKCGREYTLMYDLACIEERKSRVRVWGE